MLHLLLAIDLDPTTWTFPRQVIFNGATAGLVYGVFAAGIVLIYRSSRVINFAYGELAALSATLMASTGVPLGLELLPVAARGRSWSVPCSPR